MMPSLGEYESEILIFEFESGSLEIEDESCLCFFDLFEETDIVKSGDGIFYFCFFFIFSS